MDAPTDDDTQHTGSAGSLLSGLTSLENGTDDFGKRLLQHAKDERRMNDALKNRQPFRKARPSTRVALTLENLERNQSNNTTPRANALLTNGHRRSESPASSERSDPPVNLPREWGRKGKQGTEWLNRIKTADELVESEDWHHGDTIYPYKTTFTGDGSPRSVDWAAAAADIPIPSVEDTPSPMAQTQRHSLSPEAIRQRNTSLDRIREWEMSDDFTVGSLLTSTPAVPARSRALDEVRQREIENLNRRAVASSRLDKIKEQSPEYTKRPSTAKSFPENETANVTSRAEDFSMATVPGYNGDRRRSTQAVFETVDTTPVPSSVKNRASNESLRSLRHSSAPSAAFADKVSRLTRENQNPRPSTQRHESRDHLSAQLAESVAKIKKESRPKRPDHERSDSRELLRQLARVTSASPSPGRTTESQTQRSREENKPSPLSTQTKNADESKSVEKTGENVSAVPNTSGDLLDDAGDVHLEDNYPVKPNILREADATVISKTPLVTGAWIDTPGTQKSHRSLVPSWTSSLNPRNLFRSNSKTTSQPSLEDPSTRKKKSLERNERGRHTQPNHPTSALAAIVQDARNMSTEDRKPADPTSASTLPDPSSGRCAEPAANFSLKTESDTFGDSTIGSLEDIINPKLDPTITLDLPDDLDAELHDLQDAGSMRGLSRAERDRRQELLTLYAMRNKLRNAQTSIKDAQRGVKRVEKHVGKAGNGIPPRYAQQYLGAYNGLTQQHIRPDGICQLCGSTYAHMHRLPGWHQLWTELWTELQSLFWTWIITPNPSPRPPPPTLFDPFPTIRLTRLSRYILLVLGWLLLDSLVAYFSDHIYGLFGASPPRGYIYDDPTPFFPFAIPTTLFRPFYLTFLAPWEHIWAPSFFAVYDPWAWWMQAFAGEVDWYWGELFGWGDTWGDISWKGYVEYTRNERWGLDPRGHKLTSQILHESKATATRAAASSTGVGRMVDDEVLAETVSTVWRRLVGQ